VLSIMPSFAEPLNTVNSTLILVEEMCEKKTGKLNDYMAISGTFFIATLDSKHRVQGRDRHHRYHRI
jgi:hypothetical protein